jgi:SulP family sulfate permease
LNVRTFFPLLDRLGNYRKEDLSGDLTSGLTVGVMLIPQGMAYAMIAGLPPIYGLYASLVPLVIYGLLGTSRQLAVGPVAMVSLLVATGVAPLAAAGTAEYIRLAIVLALMVGVIQFVMGAFRLGFLVNFLSHPVISGFTSAAALIIGFSQLKHLIGVNLPRSSYIHEILWTTLQSVDQIHLPTLMLGLASVVTLILMKRRDERIPGALIVVVGTALAVWTGGLHELGVPIVGEVPRGLPGFEWQAPSIGELRTLMPAALVISLVGFMESIAVAKAMATKHKYEVDANQELIGLGLANVFGALFQAYPTTGGFSRTAVNDQSGATSGLASLISAAVIGLTLLFLTPLFYYLPNAVLAAVIMVAVSGLIDVQEAKFLWRVKRSDFALLAASFLGTLFLGIEEGIAVGVILSLAWVIYRSTHPHIAVLGRIPDTTAYRNVDRFPEVITHERTVIVRIDASFYFANASLIKDTFEDIERHAEGSLERVVLDATSINDIDSSAVHVLEQIAEDFREDGVVFRLAGVKGPVSDVLERAGLSHLVGPADERYLHVQHALEDIRPDVLVED